MEQPEFDLLVKKNGSKNLGYRTDRLAFDKKDIENALSSHWGKENKKRSYINHGHGILQDLFIESSNRMKPVIMLIKITPIHRIIIATVIQWLGTNCGFCFLREALDKAGYDIVKRKELIK